MIFWGNFLYFQVLRFMLSHFSQQILVDCPPWAKWHAGQWDPKESGDTQVLEMLLHEIKDWDQQFENDVELRQDVAFPLMKKEPLHMFKSLTKDDWWTVKGLGLQEKQEVGAWQTSAPLQSSYSSSMETLWRREDVKELGKFSGFVSGTFSLYLGGVEGMLTCWKW